MFARCLVALNFALALFCTTTASAADFPFPEVNDLELMERLEEAGAKLLAAGKGKGSLDLNKGLENKETKIEFQPPSVEPVSDEELYRRACESVFVVCGLFKSQEKGQEEWEGAFATAFVVAADGVLTTSRHFFDDPQECEIFLAVDAKGNIYPIEEILASHAAMDTCLFRIAAQDLKPLALATAPTTPGARVRVVSHPGYFFYFFSAGQVGNYFKDDEKRRWMNITADFGQGSSGAPAFDERGNVIGQVTSTLTLYAAGGELVEPLISRRRISRKPADKKKKAAEAQPGEAKPAESKPDASPAAEAPPKGKKKDKKKKKPEPEPMPEPPAEEISDPQMVFKTCAPIEWLRGLAKAP